jgi:hypothetical protein
MIRHMLIHTCGIGLLLAATLFAPPAFGTILFIENFESANGLNDGNWNSNTSGEIITDPLNPTNHVLEFTQLGSGGDLFSIQVANTSAPDYFLSFDYYVTSQPGGGFIGIDPNWLAGNCGGCYPTPTSLDPLPAGQWNQVEIEFANPDPGSGTFILFLEQFAENPAPNGLFDNIVISDTGFSPLPLPSTAPEPSTFVLMSTALLALAIAARKKILAPRGLPSRRNITGERRKPGQYTQTRK